MFRLGPVITVRYEVVKHQATKSGKCMYCGKRARRSETFSQTINPFNKNKDGTLKDRRQINVELHEEAEKWEAEPVYHQKCVPEK